MTTNTVAVTVQNLLTQSIKIGDVFSVKGDLFRVVETPDNMAADYERSSSMVRLTSKLAVAKGISASGRANGTTCKFIQSSPYTSMVVSKTKSL